MALDRNSDAPYGSSLSARRPRPRGWLKKAVAALAIAVLGVAVWSQRIDSAHGFILDDPTHLDDCYRSGFRVYPERYLPGVAAHRPIGRDALTLLFALFGENDVRIIWVLLSLHVLSSTLIWLALYRLTSNWWGSLAGAAFFLLNASAYLVIYWPAAMFDLLSALFLAGLLLSVAHFVRPGAARRPWALMLTLPLLLAAVKTKEATIVVIVPLLLTVTFAGRKQGAAGAGRPRSPSGEAAGRLRHQPSWKVIWAVLSVALVAVLALTVGSDFRDAGDPQHPYYTEYSFKTLGRSFGYYLATLVFRSEDGYPIEPRTAFILLLAALSVAGLLRSRWMLLGWVWFVSFLLPLAALKNHYAFSYYPYPADIGAALFVAGFFDKVGALGGEWKAARFLRGALPLAFVALLAQQSYLWIRNDSVPKWYDNFHARRDGMVAALKEVLPRPGQHARIVVAYPGVPLPQDISNLMRVIYRDNTLKGAFFGGRREAGDYLLVNRFYRVHLAAWGGETFVVSSLTRDELRPGTGPCRLRPSVLCSWWPCSAPFPESEPAAGVLAVTCRY